MIFVRINLQISCRIRSDDNIDNTKPLRRS